VTPREKSSKESARRGGQAAGVCGQQREEWECRTEKDGEGGGGATRSGRLLGGMLCDGEGACQSGTAKLADRNGATPGGRGAVATGGEEGGIEAADAGEKAGRYPVRSARRPPTGYGRPRKAHVPKSRGCVHPGCKHCTRANQKIKRRSLERLERTPLHAVRFGYGDGTRPHPPLERRLEVKRQIIFRNGAVEEPLSAPSGLGVGRHMATKRTSTAARSEASGQISEWRI